MDHPAQVNLKVRGLILDYAIGAAIVALLPIPKSEILKTIALVILNFLLIRGIARFWHFQKGGDLLARVGIIFGLAGSALIGFVSWVGVLILAVLLSEPRVMVVAPGVVGFCTFWGIGQTVHHFYLSKIPRAFNHSHASERKDHEA